MRCKTHGKKYVARFDIPVRLKLNEVQRLMILKALNLHHIGDEDVNELVEVEGGLHKYVGRYDDHPEFKRLQDSHYEVCKSVDACLEVGITEDGYFQIIRETKPKKPRKQKL